tara:strand:+ start:103 stop:525 length:423 start_codon:yes stop_codon:yes gene_type:complete
MRTPKTLTILFLLLAVIGCAKKSKEVDATAQKRFRTLENVTLDRRGSKWMYRHDDEKNYDALTAECNKVAYIKPHNIDSLLNRGAKIVTTYPYSEPVVARENDERNDLHIAGACLGTEYIFEGKSTTLNQTYIVPLYPDN